jgi:Putative F0F1-ATPase subunit Ca2+/Mg2+ transporter
MDETDPPQDQDEGSPPPEPSPPLGPGAVAFLTLGVAGASALVIGGAGGYLIDRWVGTSPLFTLIGLALGVALAVLMTIARVRKYL